MGSQSSGISEMEGEVPDPLPLPGSWVARGSSSRALGSSAEGNSKRRNAC